MEPQIEVASVTRAARHVGCTEGQLYTLATGLVLALLLAFAGVGPTIGTASPETATAPPTTTFPAVATSPASSDASSGVPEARSNAPIDSTAVPDPRTWATPAPPTAAPADPCPAGPALEGAKSVLDELESLTGVVPSAEAQVVLADLLGCSPGNPALDALGVLAALANRLPPPGVDVPGLPHIPLPAMIVTLVQPLRPLLDPICATVGTAATIVLLALGVYPAWISSAAVGALLPVLDACGQIQNG